MFGEGSWSGGSRRVGSGERGHVESAGDDGAADEVGGFDVLQFAGFDDGVDDAVAPGAFLGAASEADSAVDDHGAKLTFGPVVVELHAGVGDEADQVVPVFVDAFDQGFGFAFGDGGAGKAVEP